MLNPAAYMPTCRARDAIRPGTIASLYATGWQGNLIVEFEDCRLASALERHAELVRRLLRQAARGDDELFLFVEDDVDFNRHLPHNLANWPPLKAFVPGRHFYASLYNPGVRLEKCSPGRACGEAMAESVLGLQAVLIAKATARYFLTCWGVESATPADIRLARLAARVCPLLYHLPSLVQHVGGESTWRGPFHRAADFDRDWKAPGCGG